MQGQEHYSGESVCLYNISDIGLKLTAFIFSCYGFHNMEPVNSACTYRSIAFECDCKSTVPHTFQSLEEIFVGACECQMQLCNIASFMDSVCYTIYHSYNYPVDGLYGGSNAHE